MKPASKPAVDSTTPPAIDLLEEAVYLLRRLPLHSLAWYYLGSAPFVVALLYFWADMSRGAHAEQHLLPGALSLSALFVVMKVCQSLYGAAVYHHVAGSEAPALGWRDLVRHVVQQSIIQPVGMFLLPLSVLALFPFSWLYAYYQNVTVLGAVEHRSLGELRQEAWRQAKLWPTQNHLIIWLLSPWFLAIGLGVIMIFVGPIVGRLSDVAAAWGFMLLLLLLVLLLVLLSPGSSLLAAALAVGLLAIPQALHMFLGVETPFTLSAGALLNSSFLAVICGLTYLILDPLVKAAYVLRCFHGLARTSGLDLQGDLRRVRRRAGTLTAWGVAALLTLLLTGAGGAGRAVAADAPTSGDAAAAAGSLDDAVNYVLDQPEFSWRLPREMRDIKPDINLDLDVERSWLERQMKSIGDWMSAHGADLDVWRRKLVDWLDSIFRSSGPKMPNPGKPFFDYGEIMRGVVIVLAVVIALALTFFLIKWLRLRRSIPVVVVPKEEPAPAPATPDLEDESVAADALPDTGWMGIARDLIDRGEYRLALRALFLSTLANMGARQWIRIARAKSNREYLRELDRRAHALPEITSAFRENVTLFEGAWYGMHDVDRATLDAFIANVERIRERA